MKTKLQKDRRGRVLRTAAQRGKLVKSWRAFGISQAEFCAQRGIHPTTFSTWCRTAQNTGRRKTTPKVEFAEFNLPVAGLAPIEVVLPNRVTIRVRDAAYWRELLPMLRGEGAC